MMFGDNSVLPANKLTRRKAFNGEETAHKKLKLHQPRRRRRRKKERKKKKKQREREREREREGKEGGKSELQLETG